MPLPSVDPMPPLFNESRLRVPLDAHEASYLAASARMRSLDWRSIQAVCRSAARAEQQENHYFAAARITGADRRRERSSVVVFFDVADVVVVEVRELFGRLALLANAFESPPRRLAHFRSGLLALVQVFDEMVDIEIVCIDSGLVVFFLIEVV